MSDKAYYRDRTALVTGASSGIGLAFARCLAARGARVVLVARSADKLRTLANELGHGAVALPQDLEAPGGSAELVEQIDAAGLSIDVLVNNAGYGLKGPFASHPAEDVEGMVALNCMAVAGLTRRLLPGMIARGYGGVLNVASMAAYQPTVHFATYAATKAFVLRLSQALHYELKDKGVHVSCLAPGPVPTNFGERAQMEVPFFARGYTADDAARAGLKALAANKRDAPLGWMNRIQAAITPLAPTALQLTLSEQYMKAAK